jgi:hypothetical protein
LRKSLKEITEGRIKAGVKISRQEGRRLEPETKLVQLENIKDIKFP